MPKWQQLKSKKHTLFYTLQNGQKETKMEQKKRRSQTTVIYIYIICCGCCWLARKIWCSGKTGETHTFCINLKCVCVGVCVCVHRKDEKTTRYSLIDLHTLKTRKIVKLYSKKEKGKLNFGSSETTTSVPSGIFFVKVEIAVLVVNFFPVAVLFIRLSRLQHFPFET